MLFTELLPHDRAADRQRSARSIMRDASKFLGTTLAVATPILSVPISTCGSVPGMETFANSATALLAILSATLRSQFGRIAAIRPPFNETSTRFARSTGVHAE